MTDKYRIFKYPIDLEEKFQVIEMPQNARVLDVQPQVDHEKESVTIVMWALVMADQPKVPRKLVLIDTGEEFPGEVVEHFEHIKTLQVVMPRQLENGEVVPKTIVWHLFLERDQGAVTYDLSKN